jgi:hypothetical protein
VNDVYAGFAALAGGTVGAQQVPTGRLMDKDVFSNYVISRTDGHVLPITECRLPQLRVDLTAPVPVQYSDRRALGCSWWHDNRDWRHISAYGIPIAPASILDDVGTAKQALRHRSGTIKSLSLARYFGTSAGQE